MNIKKRIERLERSSNPDPEFCNCIGEPKIKVIWPVWEQPENVIERSDSEDERPENCDRCEKPIRTQIIKIESIESEPLFGDPI